MPPFSISIHQKIWQKGHEAAQRDTPARFAFLSLSVCKFFYYCLICKTKGSNTFHQMLHFTTYWRFALNNVQAQRNPAESNRISVLQNSTTNLQSTRTNNISRYIQCHKNMEYEKHFLLQLKKQKQKFKHKNLKNLWASKCRFIRYHPIISVHASVSMKSISKNDSYELDHFNESVNRFTKHLQTHSWVNGLNQTWRKSSKLLLNRQLSYLTESFLDYALSKWTRNFTFTSGLTSIEWHVGTIIITVF